MEIDRFRSPNIKTNTVEPVATRCRFQMGRNYTAPEVLKNLHHELPYRIKIPMLTVKTAHGSKEEVDRQLSEEAKTWCRESFGEESFTETANKFYTFNKHARWMRALFWFYFRRPEDLLLYQLRWRGESQLSQ